jgi:hypothetical protein
MRTKSLVLFRSKSTGFEEGKMEKASVLDLRCLGAIHGDRGADPGLGRSRVAEAQDGGRLEAGGG